MTQATVTAEGILLGEPSGSPMHVLFDGRRIWSFQADRDGEATPDGWLVPWPGVLTHQLDGHTRATIQLATGETIADDEMSFGSADARISVVDRLGRPAAIDKGGRLQHEFGAADQSVKDLLVDAVDRLLRDLCGVVGVDAFLSFGNLLGAVREGKLIGHDSDADVSFLSRHSHPFDIAREFQQTARRLRELDYTVLEMSAAHLKIWVPLESGGRVGIDVFGAYFFEGVFHMTPSIRDPHLRREDLLPQSTVTLEGRELIAPARPAALLAATYGPSWRIPDPSFKFPHQRDLTRHMAGFWRGTQTGLRSWEEFYRHSDTATLTSEPSPFASWVEERISPTSAILDLGCGQGRDAVYWASRGHPVAALDFAPTARRLTRERHTASEAAAPGRVAPLVTHPFNLLDLRDVLTTGAAYSHATTPRHVYGRLLLEELPPAARTHFWILASMLGRAGTLTFVEFRTRRNGGLRSRRQQGRPLFPSTVRVIEDIEARGGIVVDRDEGRGRAPWRDEDPIVCRLAVRWDR